MTSNIGETGVESIRLKGMKVEELPLAFAAHVAPQIKLAEDTERKNKIANVLKKYPDQRAEFLGTRIQESKDNQANMTRLISEQQQMISDYKGHIAMTKHRNSEEDKLRRWLEEGRLSDVEFKTELKDLNKRHLPYDIERLQAQIDLCHENIRRAEIVSNQEADAIAELGRVKGLAEQRDAELYQLGVRLGAGNSAVIIDVEY